MYALQLVSRRNVNVVRNRKWIRPFVRSCGPVKWFLVGIALWRCWRHWIVSATLRRYLFKFYCWVGNPLVINLIYWAMPLIKGLSEVVILLFGEPLHLCKRTDIGDPGSEGGGWCFNISTWTWLSGSLCRQNIRKFVNLVNYMLF